MQLFQPTPSLRRATAPVGPVGPAIVISTHALLAEGDDAHRALRPCRPYFNPRPPCGGRPRRNASRVGLRAHFNPRPPCGGRLLPLSHTRQGQNFNPRPPCGGRLSPLPSYCPLLLNFNPRPPCGGRPWALLCAALAVSNFNPRPPCGGRR